MALSGETLKYHLKLFLIKKPMHEEITETIIDNFFLPKTFTWNSECTLSYGLLEESDKTHDPTTRSEVNWFWLWTMQVLSVGMNRPGME